LSSHVGEIRAGVERSGAVKGSGEIERVAASCRRPLQPITDEVPSLATLEKVDSESTKARADR